MKRHTVIYRSWEVVAVPFPFTDVNVQKKRPAVVISNQLYQEQHGHCILAMITSAKQSAWAADITIINLNSAGLKSPSVVRGKIFTLDERLILKTVGVLSLPDQEKVKQVLKKAFVF